MRTISKEKMEMKNVSLLVVALFSLGLAQDVVWDFSKPVEGAWSTRFATRSMEENALCLTPTKKDCGLVVSKLSLDPAPFTHIRMTLRYVDFADEKISGQIYFDTAKAPLSGKQAIHFQRPAMNGETQTVLLSLQNIRGGADLWYGGEKITSVRFDVADQYPGKIYIEKLELLTTPSVFDFSKPTFGWDHPFRMTVTREDDGVKMDVTGLDSRYANNTVRFPAEAYRKIKIVYSAEGFLEKNHGGELFYASVTTPQYGGKGRYIRIPSLNTDGEEHEMILNANWQNEGIITGLRLDMTNAAPGTIKLKRIELLKE